eukprot:Rhum_TRINITY_DN15038_c10_g1::Rhum_TRINITY_DN15038_c10_g1_i1::g.135424::m.135424
MADADGQEDTGTLPPQYYQRKIRVLLQERSDMEAEAEELVAEVESLRRQRSELPPLVADLLATCESHKPTDILDEASSTAAAAAQLEAFGQTLLCQVRDIHALLQGGAGSGGGGASAASAANGTTSNGTVAIVARRSEDEYDTLSPSPQPATPPTAIAPTPVAAAKAIEGPPAAPAPAAAFEVPASLVSLAPERFEHCSTLDDCMRVFYDVLSDNAELQEESDVQATLVSAQARKLQRTGVEIRELEALLNQRQLEAAPTPQPASSAATHSPSTPSEWTASVAGSSAGLLPPPPAAAAAAAAAAPPATAAAAAPAATSGASLVSRSASSGTARVPTKSRSPLPQARGTVGGASRTSVTAHSITTLSPKTSYEAERMPHGPIGSHRPRPLSRR